MNTVAFFDLDYTLLDTSSGFVYIKEAIKKRRVSPWAVANIGLRYQIGLIDFGQAHTRLITQIARRGQSEAGQFFKEWIPRALLPHLAPKGKAKIEWHKRQGHRVLIISASIKEIVKPVAKYLGLQQDYLCTHLAVRNGHYTGELDGPLCYGPGKVAWVKKWAIENGPSLSEVTTYVYTDSSSDLPLLKLATHPVAVNPSRKLAKIAAIKGWPVERFY